MLTGAMHAGLDGPKVIAAAGEILEPERVAETAVEGLAAERFLILPHPEVAQYWCRKADNPDRWLAGMRRLTRAATTPAATTPAATD
jgi:hypothetical protein